jgi:peptidoglycan/LPS O-acetylase OafA/YrhL
VNASRNNPSNAAPSEAFRFSENNFDLIRLIAAGEVAVRHSYVHLISEEVPAWLEYPLSLIPGVPVFFFLSGYLISRSWERSPSTLDYFRNRALRLFPALWACITLSVLLLFVSGYLSKAAWSPSYLAAWIACQGTALQFWNPEFLRGFGTGVVNGSLWSIAVEIQFYVATAILYSVLGQLRPWRLTIALGALAVGFSAFNAFAPEIQAVLGEQARGELLQKAYKVTLLPWFYIFLLGALAQRLSGVLVPLLLENRWWVVSMYVAFLMVDFHVWRVPSGNSIPVVLVPLMGVTVLTMAYWRPGLADRILRRNDLSYGVYIHHMPLVNLIMFLGIASGWIAVALVIVGTLLLAGASWRWLERPLLRRKRGAARVVATMA